jgi:hypothetical protein
MEQSLVARKPPCRQEGFAAPAPHNRMFLDLTRKIRRGLRSCVPGGSAGILPVLADILPASLTQRRISLNGGFHIPAFRPVGKMPTGAGRMPALPVPTWMVASALIPSVALNRFSSRVEPRTGHGNPS